MKRVIRWGTTIVMIAVLLGLSISVFADSPNFTRVSATATYAKGEAQVQPSYIEPLTNMHACKARLKFKTYYDGEVAGAVEVITQSGTSKYDSNIYYDSEYAAYGPQYTYRVIISDILWVPDDTDYWPLSGQVSE